MTALALEILLTVIVVACLLKVLFGLFVGFVCMCHFSGIGLSYFKTLKDPFDLVPELASLALMFGFTSLVALGLAVGTALFIRFGVAAILSF